MANALKEKLDLVEVKLPDGSIIHVQAIDLGGEQKIAFKTPELTTLVPRIEGIARTLAEVWKKVKPQKATVEFALQLAVESGQLTALLMQGSTEANLKICLEWSEEPASLHAAENTSSQDIK